MFFVIFEKDTGKVIRILPSKEKPKIDEKKYGVKAYEKIPKCVTKKHRIRDGMMHLVSSFDNDFEAKSFFIENVKKEITKTIFDHGFDGKFDLLAAAIVENPLKSKAMSLVKWYVYVITWMKSEEEKVDMNTDRDDILKLVKEMPKYTGVKHVFE